MYIKAIYCLILTVFLSHSIAQIQLHPKNRHYFNYKDKPIVLIASSEHYGAVLNTDFDFEIYLETLQKIGLNHTRIFLGDYVESKEAFCIETNTLSPDADKFICPWQRSDIPGYALGGNKFDLAKWDDNYFSRLHQFMKSARDKDIVVEAVLFFASYTLENAPLYFKNNINKTDSIPANKYMTLSNGNVLQWQKKYCIKLVEELNRYDNLIINIANEPWFANQANPGFVSPPPEATKKWIQTVSEWIVEAEASLPKKHLISVDYSNEGIVIPEEDLSGYYRNISVFNHHYDRNARSATLNYDRVNRVLSFNETGLMPPSTPQYRIQGWKYIFSGGALYNNLDFTFQVGYEDGSGGTNFTCAWYSACSDPQTKYQMAALLRFVQSIPFINMKPDFSVVAVNYGDENIYPFVWKGHEYAVYFEGGSRAKIKLHIPDGVWIVRWINPSDLKIISNEKIKISGNFCELLGPEYTDDVLLHITKTTQGLR